ncbi:glycosyl hydrolase [Neolewinella lacunae]|uniref:Beta-mannosidase n=1 Tax=Neolewinella lacunae TaxID=1517758 RepID=A0A923T7K8_9BACT|nr:glycosyl hydrolase [Neolewinella lacunae]MBC6993684.1 beta-mannosidase [Neolewinella lacunae]MDN3636379.1 glycosyl hydrolase [Neolewinella lacunae]
MVFTKSTQHLYTNLAHLAQTRTLFGQQDALAYGVGWTARTVDRSDVKDTCGSHPAVFGWDVGRIGQEEYNLDGVPFQRMREGIIAAYRAGGVNTISWHLDNFLGGDSWAVGPPTVRAILPGGSHHAIYRERLDHLAAFFDSLETGFPYPRPIPIVFRPFHEHTGSWFWWGKPHVTAAEYRALWQFTVHYLQDEKQIHHLIWCYSPDVCETEEQYLEYYPGDDYVDVLGLDDYHDLGRFGKMSDLTRRLRMLTTLAAARGKIAALTETGVEGVPDARWWTQTLLPALHADPAAARIAWLLVWRNANHKHHYGPYPDHPSAPDFRAFAADERMVLLDGVPPLYASSFSPL